MSVLSPPALNVVFNPDCAYILSLVLSLEVLSIEDLRSVTPADINLNQVLAQLEENTLIQIKESLVYILPLALAGITLHLQKNRMVW